MPYKIKIDHSHLPQTWQDRRQICSQYVQTVSTACLLTFWKALGLHKSDIEDIMNQYFCSYMVSIMILSSNTIFLSIFEVLITNVPKDIKNRHFPTGH